VPKLRRFFHSREAQSQPRTLCEQSNCREAPVSDTAFPFSGSGHTRPVRRDGSPSGLSGALAAGRGELALYVAAGVVYVAIGSVFPEFLFSWVVGVGFLLLCVAALPALARRLFR